MAFGYTPKRTRNLYTPGSTQPFKLSRSRLENFTKCPRCFYIDRRLGMDRPPGFPFSLNSAVDGLLKKEFDIHRKAGTPHPLMSKFGIDAVPFEHPKMDTWRENFEGVEYYHPESGMTISGAVDDIWVSPKGELHVVDYKSTSKDEEVTLDADWQDGYKRQMEVYQWLLRKNGFQVSNVSYFVYANGRKDKDKFEGVLEFRMKIIPYEGNDGWVEGRIMEIKKLLEQDTTPPASNTCDYCAYTSTVEEVAGGTQVKPEIKKSREMPKVDEGRSTLF